MCVRVLCHFSDLRLRREKPSWRKNRLQMHLLNGGFLYIYLLSLILPKDTVLPLLMKKDKWSLPRESTEKLQVSRVNQVGPFIWGTVEEHPASSQAVSHTDCLLISLAIRLGQWWMVHVPLAWPGLCWDVHWPAAAVVLAALLRASPSDISYTSPWLIPLIIWTAPGMMDRGDWSVFPCTCWSAFFTHLSQLLVCKAGIPLAFLWDAHTSYPLLWKGPSHFSIPNKKLGWEQGKWVQEGWADGDTGVTLLQLEEWGEKAVWVCFVFPWAPRAQQLSLLRPWVCHLFLVVQIKCGCCR